MSQESGKENKEKKNVINITENVNLGLGIGSNTIKVDFKLNKDKLKNELNNGMIIEGERKVDAKIAEMNEARAKVELRKLNFLCCNIC